MKKRSLLFVMFLLLQVVAAGLMYGDDVRAGTAESILNPEKSGVTQRNLTTPIPTDNHAPSTRRRAGTPPKSEPQSQIEGTITAASATSITVHDSHGNEVVIALTSTTVIRKGNTAIAAADLKAGDQVHVKATTANNVTTATEVLVQSPEVSQTLEIEGTITAASATSITVHDSHGNDDVVALTSTTVIRKGDTTIAAVGSSRVDLQACKLEYSIVSPK